MSAHEAIERYRSAIEKGARDEEKVYLHGLEKRVKQLENYQALGQTPAIKDFTGWAKRDIHNTNDRLSTDQVLQRDGHEAERLAMLNRKEVLLYLIGLFDPSAELEIIEKQLSEDAETFESYQEGR